MFRIYIDLPKHLLAVFKIPSIMPFNPGWFSSGFPVLGLFQSPNSSWPGRFWSTNHQPLVIIHLWDHPPKSSFIDGIIPPNHPLFIQIFHGFSTLKPPYCSLGHTAHLLRLHWLCPSHIPRAPASWACDSSRAYHERLATGRPTSRGERLGRWLQGLCSCVCMYTCIYIYRYHIHIQICMCIYIYIICIYKCIYPCIQGITVYLIIWYVYKKCWGIEHGS